MKGQTCAHSSHCQRTISGNSLPTRLNVCFEALLSA
jgi:hypothetical protein